MSDWIYILFFISGLIISTKWHSHLIEKEERRVENIKKNLLTNVERTEIIMNEKLVSFSCKAMPNRNINWQNHYECELPTLYEDEPYQIFYNDKRIYQKEVSEEVYQQLIQLGKAFKEYEKELEIELFLGKKEEI